ncbi:GNAT family N-acetyltransferase [Brucella thiophenivorans]|uniref:GNAT family N-acetyltransferase n=1 Tax=Brucella thiophenivorans TaxID=571255 RepID=UPI0035BBF7F1
MSDALTGRLRHLYVLKAERRKGYATDLVHELLRRGRPSFQSIRLFTDATGGSAFYETLGFARISSCTVSHELKAIAYENRPSARRPL